MERLRRKAQDEKDVVMQSTKMREVYELALRLANVDATVLVQGESGVGKEVFADMVHRNSRRSEGPWSK